MNHQSTQNYIWHSLNLLLFKRGFQGNHLIQVIALSRSVSLNALHRIYAFYSFYIYGGLVQQILILCCDDLGVQSLIPSSYPVKIIGPPLPCINIQTWTSQILSSYLKDSSESECQYFCDFLSTFPPFSLLRGNIANTLNIILDLIVRV